MSRTNPYKKPRRRAKRTILFYGEGSAEEVFLKHLRKTYAQNRGIAVTVKSGQGGTADGIVRKAFRYNPGGFDQKVVLLDNDKTRSEMNEARKISKDCSVSLIENEPCLEALLLRILNDSAIIGNKSSKYYKNEFEKKHICKKKRCNIEEYEKIFPKKILDAARRKIKELDRIIGLMEGKK